MFKVAKTLEKDLQSYKDRLSTSQFPPAQTTSPVVKACRPVNIPKKGNTIPLIISLARYIRRAIPPAYLPFVASTATSLADKLNNVSAPNLRFGLKFRSVPAGGLPKLPTKLPKQADTTADTDSSNNSSKEASSVRSFLPTIYRKYPPSLCDLSFTRRIDIAPLSCFYHYQAYDNPTHLRFGLRFCSICGMQTSARTQISNSVNIPYLLYFGEEAPSPRYTKRADL